MPLRRDPLESCALGGREDLAHSEEQHRTRDIPPRPRLFAAIEEFDCNPFIGIGLFQQLFEIEFTPVELCTEHAPLR